MTVKQLVGLGMKTEIQRRAVLCQLYSAKTLAEFAKLVYKLRCESTLNLLLPIQNDIHSETTLVIPTRNVMDTPSELKIFNGNEDARKFLCLYDNVVTKGLPAKEKAEKTVAYLAGTAFDFYFDCFTMDNGPMDEAKDYGKVKKVMLEKFSVRKTESEIMKQATSLEYDGGDIQTFLTRANKIYSQAKFKNQAKFGLLRDFLKSDLMLLQFALSREQKIMTRSNKHVSNTPITVK